MKACLVLCMVSGAIMLLAFTKSLPGSDVCVAPTLSYIREQSIKFAATTLLLQNAIRKIDSSDPQTVAAAVTALKQSRLQYKNLEFFFSYFLRSATIVFNEPNKFEVEEPFMEAREPTGFQVMESLLCAGNTPEKDALIQQAVLIHTSATDLPALLHNLQINDKQIAESLLLELIRIMTLGITGFDTPDLKTGIGESKQALLSVQENLLPLLAETTHSTDSVRFFLATAIKLLDNQDFDSFDRLGFLTKAGLPLQNSLAQLIKEKDLFLNTTMALDYDKHIFSKGAIHPAPANDRNTRLIELGRRLFFEKQLSGNATRSCANCHQPEKYFTDGLTKNRTLDGTADVQRNTPGLSYSNFQYAQFWDARVKSLEEQIQTVLESPTEMGSDHRVAINHLATLEYYPSSFKKNFHSEKDTVLNLHNISIAIIAFLETLAPMNAAFDKYISGDKNALSNNQKSGFNLFMGKAQCGTCHFAPIFNGLTPPLFDRTELEVLGTTKNAAFAFPELDADSGRFNTFPIPYYQGAFKTPTLRNSAKTAPYMHNGNFETLEQIMEFYNKGGGAGLGLHIPSQTLSPKPLHLTADEVSDIIAFLNSLTDDLEY